MILVVLLVLISLVCKVWLLEKMVLILLVFLIMWLLVMMRLFVEMIKFEFSVFFWLKLFGLWLKNLLKFCSGFFWNCGRLLVMIWDVVMLIMVGIRCLDKVEKLLGLVFWLIWFRIFESDCFIVGLVVINVKERVNRVWCIYLGFFIDVICILVLIRVGLG